MWQDADAAIVLTRAVAPAAHAASHTPTWAVVVGTGLGVLVAMISLGFALVSNRQPPGREGDDDDGPGPGGGGPGRPGSDGGDAPGGAPTWWTDFERQFAGYVSERKAAGCASSPETYDLRLTVTGRAPRNNRCDRR